MLKQLPLGSRYILWMDMAAQYSFYGMNAILPLFLLIHVNMAEVKMVALMQLFISWRYLAMIAATIVSETLVTQKNLMITASIISIIGHFTLSCNNGISNVYIGLFMIAIGIGIINICIKPLIAYQSNNNQKQAAESLSLLYVFTNIGTVSVIITPWVLRSYGYHLAFISPTIVVVISLAVLIAGNRYIQNPSVNKQKKFIDLPQVKKLLEWIPLIIIICIFEAFFTQMYSSWTVQGQKMNCVIFGLTFSPAQLQILDTILIISLVPLITFKILPFIQQKWGLLINISSQLSFGFVCGGISFLILTIIQILLKKNYFLSLFWQCPAFFFLALGEIMIICIAKNLLYALGEEKLRVKLTLLYAIINLAINTLAAVAVGFFPKINSIFFASCAFILIVIAIGLNFYNSLIINTIEKKNKGE